MTLHSDHAPEGEYDIAIVGMSCRFPGAQNTDEFWQNLVNSVESIARLSDQEMLQAGVPLSFLRHPNYVKAAPILDEPGAFDAAFFGFSPLEAKTMDPQHRILLELAYEALENAGCDPDRYRGRIGVFTGAAMNTYFMHSGLSSRFAEEYIPTLIVNDKDFLSTRISYKLNLKGPSITIQTACSTSLVAIHLARQSLLSAEIDMALAGAISVRVPHKAGYFCDGGGVVSPDGHVRAFDAQANGTVFGSGGGVIVLKRLADAIAEGNTIHAVIKGSAVNNDGSEKAGYTAPSVNSQADVIIEALANAGVDADSISYIEAHGSGTPVGDPIEVLALTKAFRTFTQHSGFCAIGSVKTNVGHLDAAAGMAGIIKTALALKHRMLPPSLHYSTPNPEIDFENTPFFVNTQLVPWTRHGPRRAGVMSTGMGGTNAHVVLEEAPEPREAASSALPNLLILSAKTKTALDAATIRLFEFLKGDPALSLGDVSYTLQTGRKVFPHRRFLVCADREDAVATLGQANSKRIVSSQADESLRRPLILLLPGIGDHYVGMAHGLYEKWEVFRQEVDHCSRILEPHLGLDIREILYPKGNNWKRECVSKSIDLKKMLGRKTDEPQDEASQKLNQTVHAQPALFTIEYALSRLFDHFGIRPTAIVGHSMGEYVAACLAGVLSLEDALRLIAVRAKLVNELPRGAMLAVTLPENEILPLLGQDLSISLVNGPNLSVVAGPAQAISDFEQTLNDKGIICRRVQNLHAFHSKMLDPIVGGLEMEVRKVRLTEPKIPYISNLTGTWISKAEATDPAYWAKHANHTARFGDALNTMWQLKNPVLLEVGPGSTLGVLAMQHPGRKNAENPVTIAALRAHYENQSDCEFLLHSLGKLWLSGFEVNWRQPQQADKRRLIPLHTYPFERRKHWLEPERKSAPDTIKEKETPAISNINNWFYVPSWKRSVWPSMRELDRAAIRAQSWIVFDGGGGHGSRFKDHLKRYGADVSLVQLGQTFVEQEDVTYRIDAGAVDDYIRILRGLARTPERPLNILHLGCLTPMDVENSGSQSALHQELGFYSLLFLAQAIGHIGVPGHIRIGIVSNQVHNVLGDERVCPDKATVLGPCGAIPKEIPSVTCFNADVPAGTPPEQLSDGMLDQLLSEFSPMSKDDIVAYRGKYRWTKTYEPIALDNSPVASDGINPPVANRLRKRGVYLITGGTGGIGLAIAEYLASTFQAKLVLTKKTALPAKTEWRQSLDNPKVPQGTRNILRRLLEMEKEGGEVDVYASDACDKDQMRSIVRETLNKYGAIHGVIHAAGIVRAGLMLAKTREGAASVLSPKVQGTWVLHDVVKDLNLDFLALFSSVNSILSPLGLSDYSAANAFLDAFTNAPDVQNHCFTLTINWPGWREAGILAELKPSLGLERWKEEALNKAILTKDGLEVFQRAVNSNYPQLIVSPENLKDLLEQAREPIDISAYAPLKPTRPSGERGIKINDEGIGSLLNEADSVFVAPRTATEQRLARIWSKILGLERVGIHDDFFDLGGHSLLAVRLFAEIKAEFGRRMPMATLFQNSTLERLARLVSEEPASESLERIVVIQRGTSGRPLFFVHALSGEHFSCRPLIKHLNTERPIYGLRLPEADGVTMAFSNLQALAQFHVTTICNIQPEGPYYLAGYSYGGKVALEIAQQLVAKGGKVAMLAMIEAGPSFQVNRSPHHFYRTIFYFLRNLPFYVVDDLLHAKPKEILLGIHRKAKRIRKRFTHLLKTGHYPKGKIDLDDIFEMREYEESSWKPQEVNYRAWREYVCLPYPGQITLFRSRSSPLFHSLEPDLGWSRIAGGGLEVKVIPGNHLSIIQEPNVRQLAEYFRASLSEEERN